MPPAPLARRLSPAERVRAVVPLLALATVVLLADQLSKLWIVAAFGRGSNVHRVDLVPGLLRLEYVENTGAAFGMLTNGGWLLAPLAALVVVGIVVTAPRMQQDAGGAPARRALLLSLGLVLGGAVGNLLDRLTRGFVVDFIRVPAAHAAFAGRTYDFPNFNVADSAITVGILLLMLNLFFSSDPAGKRDA